MLHEFSYFAPKEKSELFQLLKKHSKQARLLAGGTDLLCDIRLGIDKPAYLIDIKHIPDMQGITWSERDGLAIGATVTCAEIVKNSVILSKFPLLAHAAKQIGSTQIRNRATIGGNLCTASPCADLGCSSLALGAKVEIVSLDGTRVVPLKEFFTGVKTTQLKEGEVVQRVLYPAEAAGAAWGMEKLKRIKGHDLAVVSVAVARTSKWLRVGIGSCAPTPVVTSDLPPDANLSAVLAAVRKIVQPIDDVRASREFRLFMMEEFIKRLLSKLSQSQAKNGGEK